MDWVVDTQVLKAAEINRGDAHLINISNFLLGGFKNGHRLAFDHDGKILGEYERNLNKAGLISIFLRQFINRGQFYFVSGRVPNNLTSKLDVLGFDPDDRVFVGVAYNTSDKRLLAEENDYCDKVVSALNSFSISVFDCTNAAAACS